MRPPDVYFDTNAVSDLFRTNGLYEQALRRALRAGVRARRFRLVTSGWTIEELGGIAAANWPVYRRAARFVFEVFGGVMRETRESIDREIQLRRPLRSQERFLTPEDVSLLRRGTANRDMVISAHAEHRRRADAGVGTHKRLREETRARMEALGSEPGSAVREWAEHRGRWAVEWSTDFLKQRLKSLNLPDTDYDLATVPTLVHFIAFSLARVTWYVGHGRRIESGDDTDGHHYAAACSCDVFVTGDARLVEVSRMVPYVGVRAMSVNEFTAEYLGWSRTSVEAPGA